MHGREEGLNDPLANVEQFNIIQFLSAENEFIPPLDEALENPFNPQILKHEQQISHHPHHHHVQDPHHSNPNVYQMSSSTFPDSPPTTDISGNGSTASPSSNSESPYSPDAFQNFPGNFEGLGARRINNGGLILGVSELQRNFDSRNFENSSNQLASPQTAACFMSPYPPSQQPTPRGYAQSISPDSQNENNQLTSALYNSLNVSSDGSINSQGSEAPVNRKRPRLELSTNDRAKIMHVPLNPTASSPVDSYLTEQDFGQPVIKFNKFQEESWNDIYDINGRAVNQLQVHVVADKGFNYSSNDNCFVNQKKNHFQISVHVEASDVMAPQMIKYNGKLVPIKDFKLSFAGVKAEMPGSEICIRQSRTDRKPHPHNPVLFEIQERRMTKVTVPRLHFSETTSNNQRKNLRPNPEQKYFLLVVRLYASVSDEQSVLIQSYSSEKVIVRATNPGSFEPPDADIGWNKNGGTLFSNGPVAVGTERAIGKLTVDGDIYTTGRVICPSDIRLKENITEKPASDALDNLCKLRIVDYFYKPEVAEKWGLTEEQRHRTGVIAQELAAVLPDAVKDIGDYLTVNESRVFYETVLATQELCRLTGDLDQKIDEKVAEISQRLAKYAAHKKMLSSKSSNLNNELLYDKKSLLSQSRASLASTIINNKRPARRSSAARRNSQTTCGSRVAQGTIMTLVGIMALCLLTMSSLYVLDWHNRNYGYHHVYNNNGEPTLQTSKDWANMIIVPDHAPISQPGAPPVMNKCIGPRCKDYCEGLASYQSGLESVYSSPGKPENITFGKGVQITLPQFGMIIDGRYCLEKSCNKRKQVYNLFVPVSKYFPKQRLEVQFKIPNTKVVNNCGYYSDFNHKHWDETVDTASIVPKSVQTLEDIYELSVGDFVQSAYKFRVAYSTESCFAVEENLGGNYEEYNLVFYRACYQMNTTTTAKV